MNDGLCYTIAIRQRTCQNGIPRVRDNVYTNMKPGATIPLDFGYTLTYVTGDCSRATIKFTNSLTIPTITFNIPIGTFRVFDLPTESGTYRIQVGAVSATCCECSPCGCAL